MLKHVRDSSFSKSTTATTIKTEAAIRTNTMEYPIDKLKEKTFFFFLNQKKWAFYRTDEQEMKQSKG